MNNHFSLSVHRLFCAIALLFGISFASLDSAYGANYPEEGMQVERVQPDGAVLNLRAFGSDANPRTATEAGYTVILDSSNLTYVYAILGADGVTLVSTGITPDQSAPEGLEKNLEGPTLFSINSGEDPGEAAREARWEARVKEAQRRRQIEAGELVPVSVEDQPVDGDVVGLMILAQFPDDPLTGDFDPLDFPTDVAKVDRFANQTGYDEDGNTGSIRDYFDHQSNKLLDLTHLVSPIITLPKPRNFYIYSNYPKNTILRSHKAVVGLPGTGEILTDAIAVLKELDFDLSTLTMDGDLIRSTILLFAGPPSSVGGLSTYQSHLMVDDEEATNLGTPEDQRKVSSFYMDAMPNAAPGLGHFCYHIGRFVLDLPVLSGGSGTNPSAGIGLHGLMASGSVLNHGRTPAPLNIYLKDILGWATITDITASDQLVATLPATGNVGYRIYKPGSTTEYFLFENRGSPDPYAALVPDRGIMIWHVDEAQSSNGRVYDRRTRSSVIIHYMVSLIQADGLTDMEDQGFYGNFGDGYDLFSFPVEEFSRGEDIFGFGGDDHETAIQFNDLSNPNARWWDETPSGIGFEVLSGVGEFMQVSFGGRHVSNLDDSGVGSLRWAIDGTLSGEDVRFDPALSGETINLASSQIEIGRSLGINASDLPDGITIKGDGTIRVFLVYDSSAIVRFEGLTITGGRRDSGSGGGILSSGKRTEIRNCTFYDNFAGHGSAIAHTRNAFVSEPGHMIITNTTIADNIAGSVAAVYNNGGLMVIENCTIANNRNHSNFAGAGISNFDALRLTNSIVAGNEGSDGLGGGLVLSDVFGDFWAFDINVVPNHDGDILDGPASITQDPNLAPLADNGGPTITMLPGAINSALAGSTLTKDQRGIQRPAIAGTNITLGAVEVPQGPRMRIKAPTGRILPVDSGSVRFFDLSPRESSTILAFRVANHGNLPLTGVSLSIDGPDAAMFSIATAPASELLPGVEEFFQLRFVPSSSGEKSARLLIASDDPNQSLYALLLSGKGNESYSATRTTGGSQTQLSANPTWNRPNAGEPPASLSDTATATPYDVVPFNVSRAGEYRLTSTTTTAWDNQLFLFGTSFNALAPLVNGLIGSTAESADIVYDLYPGIRYYAVTTGVTNGDKGDYTLEILGPSEALAFLPPAIESPTLSQTEASVYLEFIWKSVPGTSYSIDLGTDPGDLTSFGLQLSGFRVGTPLQHGTTYYWRLNSSDPGGVVSSGIQSFTTRDSIEVTLQEDEDDGALGLGEGDSLREAIEAAESGEASIIAFSPALSGKTIELGGTQIVTSGDFTIDGSSLPYGVTISGVNQSRVFRIGAESAVIMDTVTITGGAIEAGENGAGILNLGDLTLVDSEVRENINESGAGGGIRNLGAITLENSTLAGNRADSGGGLSNDGPGAIAILTNVTISGNTGISGGGGIAITSSASASLVHTTISNNSASEGKGGGISIDSGSLEIENSIIADNDASSGRLSIDNSGGTITASGANLIGDNTSVVIEFPTGAFAGTSSSPLDPLLSPLDFFKGHTRTMTPQPGSSALNAAIATENSPSKGQRGVDRPRGIASEIGAVESDLSSDSELSSLAISAGKLDPVFERKVNEYAALVDFDVSNVRFRANVLNSANSTSRARVNGGDYSALVYGDASTGLPLVSGLNTVEVEVTAQDLTVNTYTVLVTRGSSTETNTDLSALELSTGTLSPAFSIGTTAYSSIVGNETDSVTVTLTTGIANATAEVAVNFGEFAAVESGEASSALALDVGANIIELRVTAQDGATIFTHDLTVLREATANSNANLSNLATTAGSLRPVFGRELRSYNVRVQEGVTSTTVTPTAVQPSLATMEVRINDGTFTAINSGAASTSLALDPGANVIEVKVTSQDDATENTYSLKVTRASHNLEWLSHLAGDPANNTSGNLSMSADGRFVAFSSTATNLVAGDTNNSEDVFVYDRDNDTIERVSVNGNGQQGLYNFSGGKAHSKNPSISADGRYVAFQSRADNFVDTDGDGNYNEGEDENGQSDESQGEDIFVYDRESVNVAGTITRVSLRENGSESQQPRAENPSISADGNFVAFSSSATNLDSDSESNSSNNVNIYLYEWKTGDVERLEVDLVDFRANFDLLNPSVSEDGSFVAFELSVNRSESPQYQYKDVYLFEKSDVPDVKGTTTGITSTYEGLLSDGNHSWAPSISNDGRYIALHSNVDGIDFDDENDAIDVFLYDRIKDRTERLSGSLSGTDESFQNSGNPAISGDGRYVTFQSRASNLVEPATNGMTQIFRHDLLIGETTIMSINNSDTEGNQDSGRNLDVGQFAGPPAISFDGRFIAFESKATNLDATGGSSKSQIFVAVNDAFSASANANLAGLASNLGQLSFLGNSFSSTVSHELDAVMLSPFAVDSGAAIEMQVNSGEFVALDQDSLAAASLNVGANTINLRVTAADDLTVNSVSLNVTRSKSTVAALASLVLNGGIPGNVDEDPPTTEITPDFDSGVTAYTATAPNEVASLTVTPTLEQSDAQVTVNGESVASGGASSEIALAVGSNTITTVVTAQDNTTVRTYVTTVVRIGSGNADLADLTPSVGALAPGFTSENASYAFEVAENTNTMSITAVTDDPAATITINGEAVTSGVASSPLNLFPGINAIEISVRAPDGERKKAYSIEVKVGADAQIALTITEIRYADGTPEKLQVIWESEASKVYYLERSTDLILWEEFGDDVPSEGVSTSTEIDVGDPSAEKFFIRVGLR